MKKITLLFLFSLIILFGCKNLTSIKEDGLYAVFYTSMGKITCKLFHDRTPITVGNFVGLSEGTREFTDTNSNEKIKKPFYDGLIFHRIIKDTVVLGGCPLGTGSGSPGYTFVDEIDQALKHDEAGILSMISGGAPNTNGSQFFFTLNALPNLDGNYTVFGKIVSGIEVLNEIGNVKVDEEGKPFKPIYIKKIKIVRKGDNARAFDAEKAFAKNTEALQKIKEDKEKKMAEFLKSLGVEDEKIISTNIGLKYYLRKAGYGKTPSKGDIITAHYSGYLEDGTKFDSSVDRGEPFETEIGIGKVIPGWDQAFLEMKEGEKRVLILPYYLAYGENGYPPIIPPMATLIFDVELISTKKNK